MKLFSCLCQQVVFFESASCTHCNRQLAYLPDRGVVAPIVPAQAPPGKRKLFGGKPAAPPPPEEEATLFAVDGAGAPRHPARYRLCGNYQAHAVCNWAVPADDPDPFCRACRLNQVIPNLAEPQAKEAWHRLEIAKRRLVYTLLDLGLPVDTKQVDPARGLAFSFLKDDPAGGEKVFTGHSDGLITINAAEADDPFREKMRVQLGEGYRTLLGHFRHEIGHYYWDRLIKDSAWLPLFRARFGDETADYAESQKRHYDGGPPVDWGDNFVSAYASMHPWEDWAETWAHYLHMTDTLETARAYGLALKPKVAVAEDREATAKQAGLTARALDLSSFEDLMAGWVPLTLALNSLNRSMGVQDSYPFVLAGPAVEKLRFVHQVIGQPDGPR